MRLGKSALISKGPGASDVLTEEAILVNPEDPGALAHAIHRAWEDETLRRKTAASRHAYALSLGAEPELYQRILETAVH
jgi:trehalose-6-phosphate synthase